MVAATTPQPLTAKPTTASRNGMAKKDKDKAPAKKGDKIAKAGADKNGKKSAADVMFEGSSELRNTVAQIEKQFGEGADHAPGRRHSCADRGHPHRQPLAGHRPGRPGHSPRPRRRDLRPRIERQDDAGPARRGPGPEDGRHRRLHRRRTRPGPHLGQEARRRTGNAAGQPARQRRRGHAHHRDADQVERRRRDRRSTRWPPWCPRRNSKAKSAIRTSACRPG